MLITGNELAGIAEKFVIEGQVISVAETGNGHINDTYLVCTDRRKYILQRINTDVFRDPDALMENVVAVTEYLGGRLRYIPVRGSGKYYSRCFSHAGRHRSGNTTGQNGCWRMMTYIDNSYSCEGTDEPGMLREIGRAYGNFISELEGYPAGSLHETIPGFHDTRQRFDALVRAAETDPAGRRSSALKEIDFALEHENDVDILSRMAAGGELPVRVTHNDTKINNVMLDRDTHRAVCLIDLDTVMPGLAVNDFGDAVRSGASTGKEDEPDTAGIRLDIDMYRSLARGFMEGFRGLTPAEKRMMPYGAKTMALECGIRFLTDYLEGDHYFKTDYPGHNLVRCRAQFRLVQDMEYKWEEMQTP